MRLQACILFVNVLVCLASCLHMSVASHITACFCPCWRSCRWFKSRAHAAELTAGYYNTRERNGYLPIFEMLQRHGAAASFTCVEMRDCEHPIEGRCSPEGLLNQVRARLAGSRAALTCAHGAMHGSHLGS